MHLTLSDFKVSEDEKHNLHKGRKMQSQVGLFGMPLEKNETCR